jgi:hypothetical protein
VAVSIDSELEETLLKLVLEPFLPAFFSSRSRSHLTLKCCCMLLMCILFIIIFKSEVSKSAKERKKKKKLMNLYVRILDATPNMV